MREKGGRKRPALVLVGVDRGSTGLGLVRCLGRAGVPVVVAPTAAEGLAEHSRCAGNVVRGAPEGGEDLVGWLVGMAGGFGKRPVLFPAGDQQVIAVHLGADRLRALYDFHYLPPDQLTWLVDKAAMARECERRGIRMAKTATVAGRESCEAALAQMTPPCIVKPATWAPVSLRQHAYFVEFTQELGAKAVRADTRLELEQILTRVCTLPRPVVVQEEIDGPPEAIFSYACCAGPQGEVLAEVTARKVRQIPSDCGTGTLLLLEVLPEIATLGRATVRALEYEGLAELEFKQDRRDGHWKLIEINPRPHTWIAGTWRVGANTPLAAYLDLIGDEVPRRPQKGRAAVWLDGAQDALHYWYYRRGDHLGRRSSLASHLSALKCPMEFAYWSFDDPMPGLRYVSRLWRGAMTRLGRGGREGS